MKRYRNLHGDSGVAAYETGPDFIRVRFIGDGTYEYTARATGSEHVRNMQRLALAGRGLATYISRHVHDAWARKLD
jgi:hypothetical protein